MSYSADCFDFSLIFQFHIDWICFISTYVEKKGLGQLFYFEKYLEEKPESIIF